MSEEPTENRAPRDEPAEPRPLSPEAQNGEGAAEELESGPPELRGTVDLVQFLEDYDPHVTPELLALILVEALGALEWVHRRGISRKELYGALNPTCLRVGPGGKVIVSPSCNTAFEETFEAPEVLAGGPRTVTSDIYSAAAMFRSLMARYSGATAGWMREHLAAHSVRSGRKAKRAAHVPTRVGMPMGERIHPCLIDILDRAMARSPEARYQEVWTFRAALLEFLDELGIVGERFFLSQFMRDPVAYDHALSEVLSERQAPRVDRLVRRGNRRRAMAELNYLFEIAPESPQALRLLRNVKQRRRRFAAGVAYALMISVLLAIAASFVAIRLGIPFPFTSDRKTLLIEPVPDNAVPQSGQLNRTDSADFGGTELGVESASPDRNQSSSLTPLLEITKFVRPLPPDEVSSLKPDMGLVLLELDDDAVAYFDGAANAESQKATLHRRGDRVALPVGRHTVTVEKTGYPLAVAEFKVQPQSLVVLSGRVATQR